MAVHNIMEERKSDGVGTAMTAGSTMAVYAVTMQGNLGGSAQSFKLTPTE